MNLSIPEVISYFETHFKYATKADRDRLVTLLQSRGHEVEENFNMLDEVKEQMSMIRAIRKKILAEGSDAKEMSNLVSTTTSLFSMLTKYSNDIVNQDRIKAIEMAVIEAIKTLDTEAQDLFFRKLEELLSE